MRTFWFCAAVIAAATLGCDTESDGGGTGQQGADMGGAGGAGGVGGEGGAGGAGGAMGSETCTAFCEHLDACDSCLYDDNDECLDVAGCAVVCDAQVPAAAAECVAGLDMCDEDAFGACYDDNIGDDDCANACRVLDACEQCFTDDEGECLSLAACAVVCRDVTPPEAAACIAAAGEMCEAVDACFD